MSTNQQRLKSAIQRIARSDPQIRSLLKAVEARGDIPATGAAASNNAEQDRQCCDGSVASGGGGGGDSTVGTSTRTPDGSQTGLNGDNSADLGDMGGGSLDGLTDCETGQPVTFDGSDWIPPEGWDSPTEPPLDPTFRQDSYYLTGSGSLEGGAVRTLGQAKSKVCGKACGCSGPAPGSGCDDCSSYDGGGYAYFACVERDEDTSEIIDTNGGDMKEMSCVQDYHPICEEGQPRENQWPINGYNSPIQLAIKNGAIVGSKYDPENDGTYSKPKSEISLCDESGNQVNIKPSASGGWKSMDYSRPGDGFLYDGTGKQIARISGSEYSDPNI